MQKDHLKNLLLSNIKFAYNEALEMIVSMGMIACEEQLLIMAKDYKIEMDPLALSYHEDARVRLSPHANRELQFFFGYNFFHKALDFPFYESICSCSETLTAEAWIDILEKSSAEQVLSEMVFGVYYDKFEELLAGNDWEIVKKDIPLMTELVSATQPQPEVLEAHKPLLECLSYPEDTKLRYTHLIKQFYKDVFSPWKEQLRNESELALHRYEELFLANPERFIQDFIKNEPAMYDISTIFHVSFMSQVGNHHFYFNTESDPTGWVIFGIHNDRVFGPSAEREKTELFLKSIFGQKAFRLLIAIKKTSPLWTRNCCSAWDHTRGCNLPW